MSGGAERSVEFSKRLIEACQTDEPAKIARKIGIPYQTVKNYLAGRLPSAEQLIKISNATNVSIHWLLTGVGSRGLEEAAILRRLEQIERKLSLGDREFVDSLLPAVKESLKRES